MRLEEKPPENVVTGRDMVYWYFDWVGMGSQVWGLHSFCLQFLSTISLLSFFFCFLSFPFSRTLGVMSTNFLFHRFIVFIFTFFPIGICVGELLLFLVLPYIIRSYLTSHHHLSLALLEPFFFSFFPFFPRMWVCFFRVTLKGSFAARRIVYANVAVGSGAFFFYFLITFWRVLACGKD
ncbi:hypothetical protein B9Z19DRAFT_662208 [Tuber borchii]|uniref:Transmembrane protein n=1 Tax=Tuber borchii TaxID=42251 RepID=A0A2T6ZZW4_TUBBO|nr:hypothetical protein B9Z19DRAFT_662208 [Tuber borchii]